MSDATAADAFKLNFFTAVKALMAADPATPYVFVTYGHPGTFEPEDIVSFGAVAVNQDAATVSTNRSREEELTLGVTISCYRGGGLEMEQVCAQRAYLLLRMLEKYARLTDTTIGGAVRHCFLAGHESTGQTDPAALEEGRSIEITARFIARARVT